MLMQLMRCTAICPRLFYESAKSAYISASPPRLGISKPCLLDQRLYGLCIAFFAFCSSLNLLLTIRNPSCAVVFRYGSSIPLGALLRLVGILCLLK